MNERKDCDSQVVLLIGGTRDGERMKVETGLPVLVVPVLQTPDSPNVWNGEAWTKLSREIYKPRSFFGSGGTRHIVYVEESVTRDLVEILIIGYKTLKCSHPDCACKEGK
jgi:hypothetical protein